MKDRDQNNKLEKNKPGRSNSEKDGQRDKKLKPLPKEKYHWRKMQEDDDEEEE